MKFKVLIATILVLILIQFFPIGTENPAINAGSSLTSNSMISEKDYSILEKSCFDCHSNETKWPNYTKWQPLGWWIRGHVRGGRQKLNFSEWNTYSEEDKKYKARECIEVIKDGRMPMKSYTWMHEGSALTEDSEESLIALFEKLKS